MPGAYNKTLALYPNATEKSKQPALKHPFWKKYIAINMNITLNPSQNAYFVAFSAVLVPTQQSMISKTLLEFLPKACWYIFTAKNQMIKCTNVVAIMTGYGFLKSLVIKLNIAYVYKCKAGY